MESDNYLYRARVLVPNEKLCSKCGSNLLTNYEEKKIRTEINAVCFMVWLLVCLKCKHKIYSEKDLDNFASIKLEISKARPNLLELMRLLTTNNYKLVKITINANFSGQYE